MSELAKCTKLWLIPIPSRSARTDFRGYGYVLLAEYARRNSSLNYASVGSAWSAGNPIGVAEFRKDKLTRGAGAADSITTGRTEFWGIQAGKVGQAKIIGLTL